MAELFPFRVNSFSEGVCCAEKMSPLLKKADNLTSVPDPLNLNCIHLGPVVQSSVSLNSLLMRNSLTVVTKVFSNTLIFLLQKCE